MEIITRSNWSNAAKGCSTGWSGRLTPSSKHSPDVSTEPEGEGPRAPGLARAADALAGLCSLEKSGVFPMHRILREPPNSPDPPRSARNGRRTSLSCHTRLSRCLCCCRCWTATISPF